MEYSRCLVTIEYFRLNIEYLRNSFHFKKDGAKRHPQIFNLQSSIFNSGSSGLGELSLFHQTHGFYVHALLIEEAVTLPQGWEKRASPVVDEIFTEGNIGWCVEAHDLAASKLVAYREKDRDFVRVLLTEEMINAQILLKRICLLMIDEALRERLDQWVQNTVDEL